MTYTVLRSLCSCLISSMGTCLVNQKNIHAGSNQLNETIKFIFAEKKICMGTTNSPVENRVLFFMFGAYVFRIRDRQVISHFFAFLWLNSVYITWWNFQLPKGVRSDIFATADNFVNPVFGLVS
jgi:hypothetical protein